MELNCLHLTYTRILDACDEDVSENRRVDDIFCRQKGHESVITVIAQSNRRRRDGWSKHTPRTLFMSKSLKPPHCPSTQTGFTVLITDSAG